MSKSTPRHKPYDQMTTAELAEATKQYDREELGLPGRPLTARDRTLHRQARARKPDRPKNGQGAAAVTVSIERALLKQADALAKRRKMGRSQLFSEGLQAVLARAQAG